MDLRISGKKALVTGGASGIGLAVVKELLANGCFVHFTSRSEERNLVASRQLDLISPNYRAHTLDVSVPGELDTLSSYLLKNSAPDILVNNVGDTLGLTDPYCSLEDWHKLFHLIMGVAIQLNNTLIPHMSKNKWGRIVNITAGAAYENSGPVPYCSFKAAFTAYSRSMWYAEGNNVVMSSVLPCCNYR